MSFSSQTKDEMARVVCAHDGCALAELVATLGISGTVSLQGGGRIGAYVETEHAPTARRTLSLLRTVFDVQPELRTTRRERLGGRNAYRLTLSGEEGQRVLAGCGVLHETAQGHIYLRPAVPKGVLARKCCRRAYLRGAFLASGSISNPEKEYHLEFVLSDERRAAVLCGVLAKFALRAKMIHRKGMVVVYLKEVEHIVTLLNLVGAHSALCELENVRIHKELRNNVNRVVNCDNANLGKTIDASSRQVEAIEYIRDRVGLENLPPPLREMALVRLEQQEASLNELGELLDPPVGKSGVNHRLRRLMAFAEALRTKEEGAP